MKLQEVSDKALLSTLESANREIERRESIRLALGEIKSVLEKYSLKPEDVNLSSLHFKRVKAPVGREPKQKKHPRLADKRTKVKAKFKNPNGSDLWSGRGRAPKWVLAFCEEKDIDLATFKSSDVAKA